MRLVVAAIVSALLGCSSTHVPAFPLADGEYSFSHRFAEHPNQTGSPLRVSIKGAHITVTNDSSASVFPVGLIEEGTLLWHAASGKWIIGKTEQDAVAPEVGGCSDGPTVIDPTNKEYWSC